HARQERCRERDLQFHSQKRRNISADAHKGRLPQRELPNGQNRIHAERQQAVDAQPVDECLVGEEKIAERCWHQARLTGARPKNRAGRTQSVSTRRTKPTASFQVEAAYPAVRASKRPTASPAKSAPRISPSPPRMMTAKPFSIIASPI